MHTKVFDVESLESELPNRNNYVWPPPSPSSNDEFNGKYAYEYETH